MSPILLDAFREGAERGFLGPMELEDQLDHSLGFAWVVEAELRGMPASVLDLGSGGGLPGLVLGARWPGARTVLVEANRKRGVHLERARAALPEPGNLEVIVDRAEVVARNGDYREGFDVVTARSFGPPSLTVECGAPFVRVGGVLLVSERPSGIQDDARWPPDKLGSLGLGRSRTVRFEDRFGYRLIPKLSPINERFPRRTGVPGKRPLF